MKILTDKAFNKLTKKIENLERESFRVGDRVYVTDGSRDPKDVCFIIEKYNGDYCFLIHEEKDKNASSLSCVQDGFHWTKISLEPPISCSCCGNLIKEHI